VANATSSRRARRYTKPIERVAVTREFPARPDLKRGQGAEASMEHTEHHNGFAILFIAAFFASFAAVLIHFG
jgi:hypothetical protein